MHLASWRGIRFEQEQENSHLKKEEICATCVVFTSMKPVSTQVYIYEEEDEEPEEDKGLGE